MRHFFDERPALNIKEFEREAGLPDRSISNWLRGDRGLKWQHRDKVKRLARKYGWDGQQRVDDWS